MHILVTGGAGYIGSITHRELLNHGHQVTVVDTLEKGNREAIDPRAQFVKASVGDYEAMYEALQGVDAVMHLAGYIEVAESVAEPEKYFDNNVKNARVMLDAMIDAGVDKLVFSSTAAVYGNPTEIPIREDAPTIPINPYGESKLKFEKILDEVSGDISSIRFRYFNVAGALKDGSVGEAHTPETHIIPIFVKRLIDGKGITIFGDDYDTDDGTCVRDYIHVSDLATAHRLALEALEDGAEGGVYNLGNGEGFSNLAIAHAIGAELGYTSDDMRELITFGERRLGDPDTLIASSKKAQEHLGWKPRYSNLREIISHAYLWHKSHPEGYRSKGHNG